MSDTRRIDGELWTDPGESTTTRTPLVDVETYSRVGLSIEKACALIDRLQAEKAELLAALKGVIAGFEANAFCRSTDGDGDPAWAVKLFPHLKALGDAVVAVEKAEGRTS